MNIKVFLINIIIILSMCNCHHKEAGILCINLDQIKENEGEIIRLQGKLTEPVSKRFPPLIELEDGTTVVFMISEAVDHIENDDIVKLYGNQVQLRGIVYWQNFPKGMENRLIDTPYLTEVDYIIPID